MTTIFEEEVECCLCGEKSSHAGVGSSYSHGSPDLDTRSPEMARSTIYCWVQRCPSCGYCAAEKLVEETKASDIEEIIMKVIRYEESLIGLKDTNSHTVSEALDNE